MLHHCLTWLSLSRSLQVLSCHIPFLVSSVEDFKDHIPRETDMKVKHIQTYKNKITFSLMSMLTSLSLCVNMNLCVFPGGHECLRAVVSSRFTLRDRPGSGSGTVLTKKWWDMNTQMRTESSFHAWQQFNLSVSCLTKHSGHFYVKVTTTISPDRPWNILYRFQHGTSRINVKAAAANMHRKRD